MEVTPGVDSCPTRHSHKVTGGQICRKKHKSMQKSAINAKDLRQIFINLGKFLIHCLALGPLLNGDWTS